MFHSVEGVYRNGKVELSETPPHIEGARVIVTFLPESSNLVDLQARGIEPEAAAELRAKLQTFAPEWERPEMEAYDNL